MRNDDAFESKQNVVFFLSQKRVASVSANENLLFFFLVFLQFFRSIDLLLVKKISLLFFCREFCGASLLLELYDESFINTHVQKII